jgi:hypothetical protein
VQGRLAHPRALAEQQVLLWSARTRFRLVAEAVRCRLCAMSSLRNKTLFKTALMWFALSSGNRGNWHRHGGRRMCCSWPNASCLGLDAADILLPLYLALPRSV